MLRKLRKSSGRVTLVLIGVAALSACSDERKRDVYRSRADCLADWGNKPEDCTPATEARHAGSGFFYGPWYGSHWYGGSSGWTRNAGSSHAVSSVSSSSGVTRGGFGASGRSSAG
jgi:uncharacterized protein YgiB involved in biofilm formation